MMHMLNTVGPNRRWSDIANCLVLPKTVVAAVVVVVKQYYINNTNAYT